MLSLSRMRQRLHKRGFTRNRIVFDAVMTSVQPTSVETVGDTGSIGNAAKSGASSKRYGSIRRINGETASI